MKGLHGNNIYLAAIEEEELSNIHKWKNDIALLDDVKGYHILSTNADVKEWYTRNTKDKNQVLLGIYTSKNDFIGIARLMFIDWISKTTELGIYIGEKDFKGKGHGKEAVSLLINYAFNELNFHKINLRVLESNLNAKNLYLKAGFEIEGIQKEQFWINGKYENVVFMGLLKKVNG